MTWRLTTIVSTATAGAERGGRDAAIELGLAHAGWRPAGYDLPAIYAASMRETSSTELGMARRLNVQDSDGTLIVSFATEGDGVVSFVEKTAARLRTAYLHVVLPAGGRSGMPSGFPAEVCDWIRESSIRTLHVAGPTEDRKPGIQEATRDLLVWVLEDEVDIAERAKPVRAEIEQLAADIAGGVTDAQLDAALRAAPGAGEP